VTGSGPAWLIYLPLTFGLVFAIVLFFIDEQQIESLTCHVERSSRRQGCCCSTASMGNSCYYSIAARKRTPAIAQQRNWDIAQHFGASSIFVRGKFISPIATTRLVLQFCYGIFLLCCFVVFCFAAIVPNRLGSSGPSPGKLRICVFQSFNKKVKQDVRPNEESVHGQGGVFSGRMPDRFPSCEFVASNSNNHYIAVPTVITVSL
jgi:hypothetical protein